jgi:hypothetical protein
MAVRIARFQRWPEMSDLAESGHSARQGAMSEFRQHQIVASLALYSANI